jgi:putative oxidoreductase
MFAKIAAFASKIYALLGRFEGVPILLVRIVLGVMFAQSGYGKLFTKHASVVEFFTGLGIPMPAFNAWFVGGVEFFGGMLLIVGLGTRIWAIQLAFTMLIATLTANLPDLRKKPDFDVTDLFFVPEVLALLLLLWMVFSGPGPLSLDRLAARKFTPPPSAKPPAGDPWSACRTAPAASSDPCPTPTHCVYIFPGGREAVQVPLKRMEAAGRSYKAWDRPHEEVQRPGDGQ